MSCFILDNSTQTADVFVELTPCKLLSRCNDTNRFLPTTLSNKCSSAIGFNLNWSSMKRILHGGVKI